MSKTKLFIIFAILLNLTGCSTYSVNQSENIIMIDKININHKYEILSKSENIKGIAMFEECGRPNKENTNVVIGAHSGTGEYALFNEINNLKQNDEIIIYYNNKKYIYIVEVVKEVKDTDIEVLENKDKSILTLLTCKINDNSKRIIVISTKRN